MLCFIQLQTVRLVVLVILAAATFTASPIQAEDLLVVGGGDCTTDEGERCLFSIAARIGERRSIGVGCLRFDSASGPGLVRLRVKKGSEAVGGGIFAEVDFILNDPDKDTKPVRDSKALLVIAEDAESVALLFDDQTIVMHFEPGSGVSILNLADGGPTNFLTVCAGDGGTRLSLAVAHDDEGRAKGFGFVESPDSPDIPIQLFEVLTSGRGRNEELELAGEAAVEIRGTIFLLPTLVLVDPADSLVRVSIPQIGADEQIILLEDDILAVIER